MIFLRLGIQWNGYTKWFQVTAQIDVDFFSDEIECPLIDKENI